MMAGMMYKGSVLLWNMERGSREEKRKYTKGLQKISLQSYLLSSSFLPVLQQQTARGCVAGQYKRNVIKYLIAP